MFSRQNNRWAMLAILAGVLTGVAFLVSASPIGAIANGLTFDPSSAWARQYEWQVAGTVIEQSPWFGVAFFQWPAIAKQLGTFESVDSLWLALALGYGLPGAILVGASVLAAACAPIPRHPGNRAANSEGRALAELLSILLILTIYLGFTVDYWASLWVIVGVQMGLRTSRGCAL
jgi:O-antigen ligase